MQTPRAHRTTELAKELSRRGHEVTLYAVLGDFDYSNFIKSFKINLKNIKIKYQLKSYNSDGFNKRNLIDRILGKLFGKIFEFPNIEFLNRIPSIFKFNNDYDVLISISDPHQIHWGCAKAKKIFPNNFPKLWIADSGDPFMENDNTNEHLKYFAKYEKNFCNLCDYITVPIEEAKNAYYKEFHNKLRVIPQGFNFNLNNQAIEPNNQIISFAYAGTFLNDIRNPKHLLDYLISINKPYNFHIFTPYTGLIKDYIDNKTLKDKLIVSNFIPREELLSFLSKMDFLINLDNYNTNSQLPSKLIDYAITGRPILSLNPKNIDKQKIDQFFNKNYNDKHEIKNLDKYHIKNVVNQFSELFN